MVGDPRPPSHPLNTSDHHIQKPQASNGQISVDLTLNSRPEHIAPPTHTLSKTARKTNENQQKYIPSNRSGVENRWKQLPMVNRKVRSSKLSKNRDDRARDYKRERERERDMPNGRGRVARAPPHSFLYFRIYLFIFLFININISIILNYLF